MPALASAPHTKARPTSKDMSAAGLRAFFNIAQAWGLSAEDQMVLLGVAQPLHLLQVEVRPAKLPISGATPWSVSPIFWASTRPCKSCCRMRRLPMRWVKKPNTAPLFGGKSALDRMLGGNIGDLLAVRQYLDSRRGGWA